MLDALIEWFFGLLYKLQAGICYLIDFIKAVFFKLCGLDTVLLDGENTDLVSSLVMSNTVHKVFLTIFLIGVILLTIFVIIALIKSNYQASEKKGRGAILTKAGQSFLIFIIIPFLLFAAITLVNAIMGSINTSMQQFILADGHATIGGQMLTTTGFEAYIGDAASREEIERMFVSGQLDYNNLKVVKKYYDVAEINYLVGLLGGIVILIMFVLSSITFIQRIFDIILLYIISPVSVATIPLDDGNRFKLWKDMIISKVLSAYGIIIVMNLFFLIIPQVSRMTFFENAFQNGVVYVLFLIGGAFAVTKANLVISQLCGSQAGGREFTQMLYNFRSGIAFAKAGKGAVGAMFGKAVGGNDYLKSRKQGHSRGESMNLSIHSNRNQQVVQSSAKHNKAKQIATMPLRLATMPIGMAKDLMSGGLIRAGKNFIPRLKNIACGSSLISRAETKAKAATNAQTPAAKNDSTATVTGGKDTPITDTQSTREKEQNNDLTTHGQESAVISDNKPTNDMLSMRETLKNYKANQSQNISEAQNNMHTQNSTATTKSVTTATSNKNKPTTDTHSLREPTKKGDNNADNS